MCMGGLASGAIPLLAAGRQGLVDGRDNDVGRGWPGVLTCRSEVAAGPGFTWLSTAAGTVVTCRTIDAGAACSLALWCAGVEVSLTPTSAPTMASTAVIAPASSVTAAAVTTTKTDSR